MGILAGILIVMLSGAIGCLLALSGVDAPPVYWGIGCATGLVSMLIMAYSITKG